MEREKSLQKEIDYVRKYVLANLSHNYIKRTYYYIMWQYYKKKNEKEYMKNDKICKK